MVLTACALVYVNHDQAIESLCVSVHEDVIVRLDEIKRVRARVSGWLCVLDGREIVMKVIREKNRDISNLAKDESL